MKNTCIVLHNHRSALEPNRFTGIIDAYISGGYYFDRLEFLPCDDSAAIRQALAEAKNFSDTLTVIADPPIQPSIKEQIGTCYNVSFLTQTTLDSGDKTAFVLPFGENGQFLAREEIVPFLDRKYNDRCARMVIKAVGVPQELLEETVREAKVSSGDKLNYNVSTQYDDTRIEVIYDVNSPKMLVDDVMRIFAVRLAAYIYALEDISLAERLHQALRVRKMNVSVAESFTGGGITKMLVDVPGISDVLQEGVVSYSNDAKMGRLQVRPYTLKANGAVSDDTAYEMALGLINTGKCDLAIATTGLAGPKSDPSGKPIGLCYIAIGLKEEIYIYKFMFEGDRKTITEKAIRHALFRAYKQIK
ncbi:MAG: CinA family protein [Clostridia bacterium]|nr:CinA family protein [Clostridia bacterium]